MGAMLEATDELALGDISASANAIWCKISSRFKGEAVEAGSTTYKGMTRHQVESRVLKTHEKQCGSDIFQTIEQPSNSMVKNSKQNFLQVNCTFPDGEDTERMIG